MTPSPFPLPAWMIASPGELTPLPVYVYPHLLSQVQPPA